METSIKTTWQHRGMLAGYAIVWTHMANRITSFASLVLMLIGSAIGSVAEAATFTCREDGQYEDWEARDYRLPAGREYCKIVVMSGPILAEDANAFKAWLLQEPYTHIVKLRSPGGSVEAAMEIGRVIRSRFMQTWSDTLLPETDRNCSLARAREAQIEMRLPTDAASIKRRQAICYENSDCRIGSRCCLSACVLILAGGGLREPQNIGLHRPSLRDFNEFKYEDGNTRLRSAHTLIEQYLKEMDLPPAVFAGMMRVAPDNIQMLTSFEAKALFSGMSVSAAKELEEGPRGRIPADFGFSASIYDWLRPKCAQYGTEERASLSSCIKEELQRENIRRANRLNIKGAK